MQITYKIAMAAGQDAANRQMKKAGRTEWSEEDFSLAAEVANRLMMRDVDFSLDSVTAWSYY